MPSCLHPKAFPVSCTSVSFVLAFALWLWVMHLDTTYYTTMTLSFPPRFSRTQPVLDLSSLSASLDPFLAARTYLIPVRRDPRKSLSILLFFFPFTLSSLPHFNTTHPRATIDNHLVPLPFTPALSRFRFRFRFVLMPSSSFLGLTQKLKHRMIITYSGIAIA